MNGIFLPSVRPSITPFWLCSHHRIIMKFLGVTTNDRSDVHAKSQGQRSKVKVTEVNTQLSRFRTVTPVWIHIWWWNDAQSLMLLRRGAHLFFKVIHQISRSQGSKNRRIWPKLAFPDFKPASNDLGVYVNKFGKTSVVWRYTLQSIGPSGIALNYQ